MQGTSMAAPHVTGACALIKQAHPDWGPEKVKAALMNTAKPITDQKGRLYRTYEQGAGRIQLEEAINTQSIATPASLQFGRFMLDQSLHEHKQYVTVENVSSHRITYSFKVPLREEGIQWKLPLSFSLEPKEKRKIGITLIIDPQAFKGTLHDGQLELMAGTQKIRIPYLYVLEEPAYPRVMGFDFGVGDREGSYRYEVYLPGGAEEFGIALFDPDSYKFIGFLDVKRNVGKGLLSQEITGNNLPESGMYLAKVFAKKAGQEDMLEAQIFIPILTDSNHSRGM
jgi:minor extracellular serine protease Vpr